mmetsp:Transcript_74331/g.229724  ORF Transcript_74331/g.229724 Transcript_74331/m.229724 type:complete len:226 (-) Transcript_74331:29-706(-)
MFDYDEIEAEDPTAAVRLNFSIDEKMLPVKNPTMRLPSYEHMLGQGERYEERMQMFVKREGMTPQEITSIWENEWKVRYASRLKFMAPLTEEGTMPKSKYLHARLDPVPSHPAVIRLEGIPSVIQSLVGQLRLHDPAIAKEELEEAEEEDEPSPQEAQEAQRQLDTVILHAGSRSSDVLSRWAEAQAGGAARRQRPAAPKKEEAPEELSEAEARLAAMLCLDEDD